MNDSPPALAVETDGKAFKIIFGNCSWRRGLLIAGVLLIAVLLRITRLIKLRPQPPLIKNHKRR
jgi:hypothetical protein